MTFALSTPLTGAPQTGFTTPTYTLTVDTPPAANAKQWVVSGLGGTQTGVNVHTVAAPFTISMFRPQNLQVLAPPNTATGLLARVPMNTYKVITRKGVLPLAGQSFRNMTITTIIEVPAGADTADQANVKAAIAAHAGALWQQSAGVGDTLMTGTL